MCSYISTIPSEIITRMLDRLYKSYPGGEFFTIVAVDRPSSMHPARPDDNYSINVFASKLGSNDLFHAITNARQKENNVAISTIQIGILGFGF
uniref:Uncharacterized protein n=1 Tax=Arundo donax TaxID=35708 RepID=A0A0A8YV42_ARUDO